MKMRFSQLLYMAKDSQSNQVMVKREELTGFGWRYLTFDLPSKRLLQFFIKESSFESYTCHVLLPLCKKS